MCFVDDIKIPFSKTKKTEKEAPIILYFSLIFSESRFVSRSKLHNHAIFFTTNFELLLSRLKMETITQIFEHKVKREEEKKGANHVHY